MFRTDRSLLTGPNQTRTGNLKTMSLRLSAVSRAMLGTGPLPDCFLNQRALRCVRRSTAMTPSIKAMNPAVPVAHRGAQPGGIG